MASNSQQRAVSLGVYASGQQPLTDSFNAPSFFCQIIHHRACLYALNLVCLPLSSDSILCTIGRVSNDGLKGISAAETAKTLGYSSSLTAPSHEELATRRPAKLAECQERKKRKKICSRSPSPTCFGQASSLQFLAVSLLLLKSRYDPHVRNPN